MAVQGKLVPQDPADEPASVLLERIRAEKQQLIAEGKIKRDKHESVIFRRDNSHYEKCGAVETCIDDIIPFALPESWEWIRLSTVLTSTETLADICKAVPIPVNAIGGLNKNNIDVLAGIPIAGICVVSAIMKAESPKTATIELKARAKELGII